MRTWDDIREDSSFWPRGGAVLLLDYDGTLAPFVTDPAKAVPYEGVRELLALLLGLGSCRTVFVTGRTAPDLLRLLDLPAEIWGSHGAERLFPDGRLEAFPLSEARTRGLAEASRAAHDLGLGRKLETKPCCLAIHWRGEPPPLRAIVETSLRQTWEHIAIHSDLSLHPFDGGLELRVPGLTKAKAVAAVLAETPPDVRIAFLGDDLTDEDGFAVMTDARSTPILVRPELRPTKAAVWLRPPEELRAFLAVWAEACRASA